MSKKNKEPETFAEMCLRKNWGGRTEYRDGKAIKVPNEPLDPDKREVIAGTFNKPVEEEWTPGPEDWAMLAEMLGNRQGPGVEED